MYAFMYLCNTAARSDDDYGPALNRKHVFEGRCVSTACSSVAVAPGRWSCLLQQPPTACGRRRGARRPPSLIPASAPGWLWLDASKGHHLSRKERRGSDNTVSFARRASAGIIRVYSICCRSIPCPCCRLPFWRRRRLLQQPPTARGRRRGARRRPSVLGSAPVSTTSWRLAQIKCGDNARLALGDGDRPHLWACSACQ